MDMECSADGKAKLHREYAVTVLNESASGYNELDLIYNKLISIDKLKGSVYNAAGKLVSRLVSANISDRCYISRGSFYEDNRIKSAHINYNNYPYTVVFEYIYTLKDYLEIPDWHPLNDYYLSVESADFTLTIPASDSIKYKLVNFKRSPEINRSLNSTTYRWHLNNVVAITNEPYSPDINLVTPHVRISSLNINYGGSLGRNHSWKEFGKFVYDLNKDQNKLSSDAVSNIMQLTNNCQTDLSKIRVLYQELQNSTRYVNISLGIGGYKTNSADYVFQNNYGDCKALSNYMQSMLNCCGIESYWALVKAGSEISDIDTGFSSAQFNHVILAIPQIKDTIWLECTSQELPFNYLGTFTGNRHALLLTPEGGKLTRTPNYNAYDNQLITTATVLIDNNGLAHVETDIIATGFQSGKYEHVYQSYSDEEKEKWLYAELTLPSFKIISFKFSEIYQDSAAMLLNLKTELSHYVVKSGSRFFLNPNMYSNYIKVPAEVSNRKLCVVKNVEYFDTDSIVYKIPSDYKIEGIPDTIVDIKTDFGHYVSKIVYLPSTHVIIYTRSLEMKRFNKPADQYIGLRDFFTNISKADNRKVVLVKK
jgi:hypothetical protein